MKIANNVIEMAYDFSRRSRNIINPLTRKKIAEIIGMAFVIESLIRIAMSSYMAEIAIDEKMVNV